MNEFGRTDGDCCRPEMASVRCPASPASRNGFYLRWRILARMRRFFRPTLRRPLLFLIRLTAFRERGGKAEGGSKFLRHAVAHVLILKEVSYWGCR